MMAQTRRTMRAVDIRNGTGPASSLYINDATPYPTLQPTHAIVKIKCFGLNRMDLLQREGKYPLPPQAGKILGVEFSGTVEELGSQSEGSFKTGDEVFGLAYGGAYAEYITVSTHMLIHKPRELSWEICAGIPETWITATQALHLIGEFAPGKSVLWHAGASSVSIAGIQLSKAEGAGQIFVTAGSEAKIDFCKSLGATAGYNYKDANMDWSAEIMRATGGKGVDIIIDFIGAHYIQPNFNCIARDGRIVQLGLMGGAAIPEGVNIGAFIGKRVRWEGSSLRSRDEDYQGKLRDMLCEHAVPRIVKGEMKVPVEKVFGWAEVREAHEFMEGNTSMGKIICRVE